MAVRHLNVEVRLEPGVAVLDLDGRDQRLRRGGS